MEVLAKNFFLKEYIEGLEIITNFKLGEGYGNLNDIAFSTFRTILNSCTNRDYEFFENKVCIWDTTLNIDELLFQLKKYSFIRVDFLLETSIMKTTSNVIVASSIKKNNEEILIKSSEIRDYLQNSFLFRLSDKIGDKRIDLILRDALSKIQYKDKIFVIELSTFCSLIEWENKILCRFPLLLKGKNSLTYLKSNRLDKLAKIYDEFYKENRCIGEKLQKDNVIWQFVDGVKLYHLIYKFGSQHKKYFYLYNDYYIIKPYRWNYVIFVKSNFIGEDNIDINLKLKNVDLN